MFTFRRGLCTLLLGIFVLTSCFPAAATAASRDYGDFASFYVAVHGNDQSSGSKQAPFRTLKRAKEAVRSLISSGRLPENGARVYVRGGTYYQEDSLVFEPEDSGTEHGKITYTAYPGEKVILTGAKSIDQKWFRNATPQETAVVLDREAASRVLVVDLKAHGIAEYGELNTRGYHYFNKGQYMAAELIVNGENQTLARFPNEGTIPVNNKNLLPDELAFTYDTERPSLWANASDVWICGTLSINYENNDYPVASIDTVNHKIKLKEGKIKTYYTNGWFYAENLLEEMDTAGEYYIDRTAGKLFYLPSADFATSSPSISLSTLGKPMFRFNGASNIVVSGMTIEGGRGYAALGTTKDYHMVTYGEFLAGLGITPESKPDYFNPASKSAIKIASPALYPEAQVFPGHIWDGFTDDGPGVKGIEFRFCVIRDFGQGGLIFRGTGVRMENNEIKNIGGTGIFITGGDYETLQSSGNTIISNSIHRVGYQHRAYNPAVAVQGVGCRIAYNDIYDGPHCIMNFGGNDHVIEFNKIHDAVKECLDMDAIYTRNEVTPQRRGTVIQDNYIYNLGIYPVGEYKKQFNVCGIRTDNNGHALQLYRNIFANIGSQNANNVVAVRAQGTRNTLKGNIFVDCSATYWGFDKYKPEMSWNTADAETNRRLELVKTYAAKPVYAARYPELLTFDKEFYAAVATNTFAENLTVNMKFPLSLINGATLPSGARGAQELMLGDNNTRVVSDPGFADYAAGNYALDKNSAIVAAMPSLPARGMDAYGPGKPAADILLDQMADIITNLDVMQAIRTQMLRQWEFVAGAMNQKDFRTALIHLKLILAESRIMEKLGMSKTQADALESTGMMLCQSIRDASVVAGQPDSRFERFGEFFGKFMKTQDKQNLHQGMMDMMDDLIRKLQ